MEANSLVNGSRFISAYIVENVSSNTQLMEANHNKIMEVVTAMEYLLGNKPITASYLPTFWPLFEENHAIRKISKKRKLCLQRKK